MGDIGVPELLIILAILLICFGPSRLTGLGKSLGDGIRSFRESVRVDTPPVDIPAAPDLAIAASTRESVRVDAPPVDIPASPDPATAASTATNLPAE